MYYSNPIPSPREKRQPIIGRGCHRGKLIGLGSVEPDLQAVVIVALDGRTRLLRSASPSLNEDIAAKIELNPATVSEYLRRAKRNLLTIRLNV